MELDIKELLGWLEERDKIINRTKEGVTDWLVEVIIETMLEKKEIIRRLIEIAHEIDISDEEIGDILFDGFEKALDEILDIE